MSRRRQQRGVALLTAIVLVAIAAVIATTIAFNSAMTARRAIAVFTVAQALRFTGARQPPILEHADLRRVVALHRIQRPALAQQLGEISHQRFEQTHAGSLADSRRDRGKRTAESRRAG